MTPLETMAKAAWDKTHVDSGPVWADVPEIIKRARVSSMCAALIALAEAELLPMKVVAVGAERIKTMRDTGHTCIEAAEETFSAMLRAIAEDNA